MPTLNSNDKMQMTAQDKGQSKHLQISFYQRPTPHSNQFPSIQTFDIRINGIKTTRVPGKNQDQMKSQQKY